MKRQTNKTNGELFVINLKSISKNSPKKPRIVIYGPSGIGKTTFGASAPDPIFILTEDGLGDIDVPHYPLAKSYDDVMDALDSLLKEDHEFKTVVIDSLDWTENLVWEKTCSRLHVSSIEEPGYGRGYVEASTEWKDLLDILTRLRDEKDMIVIMIAHGAVVKIEDPIHPAYDQNGLKLHKRAAAKVEEYADILGFCALKTLVTTEKEGFNQTRNRAIDTGIREMYLTPSAGFKAKNRYRLPPSIPLDYSELEKLLPYAQKEE
jgi:hypothetical protein